MKYTVQISLAIRDALIEPNKISLELGISPYSSAKKGERRANPPLPKNDLWTIRSTSKSFESDVEEHWASLALSLIGKELKIRNLIGDGSIILTVIVDGSGRFPPLYLPKEMIEFCADVGAAIDIDIYQ